MSADLLNQLLTECEYSEEVELAFKGKTPIVVKIRVLSQKELEDIRLATRRSVAKDLEIPVKDVDESSTMFTNQVYARILFAGIRHPDAKASFCSKWEDILGLPPDVIIVMVETYNQVVARGSIVEHSDSEDASMGLFERLQEASLTPESFFAQSSATTQLTLLRFLVSQLSSCLKANASLTSRLDELTKASEPESPLSQSSQD